MAEIHFQVSEEILEHAEHVARSMKIDVPTLALMALHAMLAEEGGQSSGREEGGVADVRWMEKALGVCEYGSPAGNPGILRFE